MLWRLALCTKLGNQSLMISMVTTDFYMSVGSIRNQIRVASVITPVKQIGNKAGYSNGFKLWLKCYGPRGVNHM